MNIRVCAIAAMDSGRVIGKNNSLPWNIPEDLKRFSALTKGHSVLMGRRTYESIPAQHRPLSGRQNIVITRGAGQIPAHPDVATYGSPEKYLADMRSGQAPLRSEILWVIGGEQVYRATLNDWDEVYLTIVEGKHSGDAFFPVFEDRFVLVSREDYGRFAFVHYKRKTDDVA